MPPIARLRLRRAAVAIALCAVVLVPARPLAAADERYVAWLADGTKLTASTLPAWPIPGVPYRLEGRDLLAPVNPVRLVRDRRASVALVAPFMTLANGDVLSAAPVQLEPELGRVGQVPRVKVQLEPPLMPVSGAGISVRTDRIQRIVMSAEAPGNPGERGNYAAHGSQPPPGTVVLADGRRLVARSIRWREYGLAILTAEGIVEAAFGDLLDVVFPRVDLTAAVLDDNLWAGGTVASSMARFQMTGGSVITAARISREQEQLRRRGRLTSSVYYYVQPAWAEQPLALPEAEVAWCGYRLGDEAPLSHLPAETLANRRLIGQPEPWVANRAPDGGVLAALRREADIGVSAHAHSAIAFSLPESARTLQLSVGLDRSVGSGGCVRCKIVGEKQRRQSQDQGTLTPAFSQGEQEGTVLWDSGVIQGRDGLKATGRLDVAGLARVVLVTEFADADRPAGADPLDIRDQVVWLAPLIKLDLAASGQSGRMLTVLPGASEWRLSGDPLAAERDVQLASRWNPVSGGWDSVLTLPRGGELRLRREIRVTSASDVVELLTACPVNLAEHDLTLTVNGEPVPWFNNADRNQLRQWVQRYGRMRTREDDEASKNADWLAYWWDLAPWRGQEVTLELVLRGGPLRNEIAWRGLAIRSAIGNLPASGEPLSPDVHLTALAPLDAPGFDRGRPLKDAIPKTRQGEPIRFLGQEFRGGYGMARNSSISFRLKPEYHRFVAVVGCCFQVAGPLQVLIDDRVVWERTVVNSLTPAEQIEIPLPAGAKTLTLQSSAEGSNYGFAAFANAGFVTGK